MIKKDNNFPALVENVGLFWKLRITTLSNEPHKEELFLTLMCSAGQLAFSHSIKIRSQQTQGQAFVFYLSFKLLKTVRTHFRKDPWLES